MCKRRQFFSERKAFLALNFCDFRFFFLTVKVPISNGVYVVVLVSLGAHRPSSGS